MEGKGVILRVRRKARSFISFCQSFDCLQSSFDLKFPRPFASQSQAVTAVSRFTMASSFVTFLSGGLLLLGTLPGAAAEFKVDSHDAIIESSRSLARDMMTFYHGDEPGQTPGILPGPPPAGDYYWYTGASFFATYLDYWHLTGDDSYNNVTSQGLLFQVGPNDDYMPPNVTASLGNDDQCFWGTAALLAAEYQFPTPEGEPRWIDLAENVWRTQADPIRHDDTCGGGLRWQIPLSNNGYEWKQSE